MAYLDPTYVLIPAPEYVALRDGDPTLQGPEDVALIESEGALYVPVKFRGENPYPAYQVATWDAVLALMPDDPDGSVMAARRAQAFGGEVV